MKSDFPADPVGVPTPVRRRGISRRAVLLGGVGLAGMAAPGTAAYAGIEANTLRVTTYRPKPAGWPQGQKLSITVIADLHAGGPNMGLARIREMVDVANLQRSDLIVLLGDYFATHRFITEVVPHKVWAAELARLKAPLGVHAILGNHDWWFDIAGTRSALADVKIPVMENDAVLIEHGKARFWLAGIGDQIAFKLKGIANYRGVDDLPGTLAKIRTDDPVILMVHEPDIFVRIPDRVALTLAGHTHGGQVRVPLIWPRFVPSGYGARFAYGHIVEDNRHMIVSGGLGTSIAPVRLGVPPEIVRIELG
jgi:uncharacterized protein